MWEVDLSIILPNTAAFLIFFISLINVFIPFAFSIYLLEVMKWPIKALRAVFRINLFSNQIEILYSTLYEVRKRGLRCIDVQSAIEIPFKEFCINISLTISHFHNRINEKA